MARSVKCGLVLSLVCCCLATCLPVLAAPSPHVTLDAPGDVLIGEDFTFTVTFYNDGDMGFGPFIDLVLQFGGIDQNGLLPPPALPGTHGPCDGITILSAEMVGGGPIPFVRSPSPCGAADCQAVPYGGPLTHPAPQVDVWGVGISGNPAAPVDIFGLAGAQLWMLTPLIGSYDSSQPPIVVRVTAQVHDYADADQPLVIRARGGFLYGSTPEDDYLLGDLPILSDDKDSATWQAQVTVTPRAFTLSKAYLGPEHEAVSGPNFASYYPLRFQITVDVADGQTIDQLNIIDALPAGVTYLPLSLLVLIDNVPATLIPSPGPCPTPPSGSAVVVEPGGSGGTLEVTLCDPILGHIYAPPVMPHEVVIFLDFYIEDIVPTDADCTPSRLVNAVSAAGFLFPLDPRDQPGQVTSGPAQDYVDAKCMAIQKSVVLYDDPDANGLTPGDTLKYTLLFQISDYRTIGAITILDKLSDGQILSPNPLLAPLLTIQDQFGSYTVGLPGSTLTVQTNSSSDCVCCCCSAVGFVRGVTDLAFDISGALAAAAPPSAPRHLAGILTGDYAALPTPTTPAIGRLDFYAQITDEFFVSTQSPGDKYVDKEDPINNCVTINGEIYRNKDDECDVPNENQGRASDKSNTCVALAPGTLSKEVYAVNYAVCSPSCGAPDVSPGDAVTFRIQYKIPSGDAENLWIRDWLPVPIFDVSDPTNTNGAPLSVSTVAFGSPLPPATGLVACGPNHSQFQFGPVTWFPPPLFTAVMPDNSNSFKFEYDSPWDTLNTAKTIDLLFTLTVTNEPFADGLYLTNETQECEDNTFGVQFCQTAIAQVHVREPKLSIQKGVIATSNPSGVFTINSNPAPLDSGSGLPIATPPSASCACLTPPITSGSSLAGFIGRDLRNINAGDWVTFAIVVENTGGAPAYEVEVKDVFPLGSDGNPSCFYPVFPGFSTTLPCVTDGAGVLIPFMFTPGSGQFVIELLQPLAPLNSVTSSNGANIAIITFPATSAYKPHLQSDCCPNTATLIRYTSAADITLPPPGVSVIQPNFVDAGIGGPFQDTALICVGPTAYSKCVEATSEPHTTPETAGSALGTLTPTTSNTVNAAIGEIVRFRLIMVIPEGTTSGFQITDLLPEGLTYIGNPKVSFVVDVGIGTIPYRSWLVSAGDEATYGSCPGPRIPPGALDVCCGTAPFPFGSGQDPVFFVQSSTLPAPYFSVNNLLDHDANLELAIVEFNAQVDNIPGNQDGTMLPNSFQATFVDPFSGSTIPSLSDPVFVRVVEPTLTLKKTASLLYSSPVQNVVGYSVTISNNSDVDAFDIILTDTLPAGLTVGGVSCPGCTDYSSGNNVEVHCDRIDAHTSLFPPITYPVISPPALQCDRTITNTAAVTWTSLPGTNGTLVNPTGQSTVGVPGDPDGERDGSDGMLGSGVLNDYQAQKSATITIPGQDMDPPACAYPLPNGICAWWPLDETSGGAVQDAAGGFDGTAYPGPIGGVGGPVTSASPSPWPSFFPVGQVDSSLFFYGTRHIEVPHDSNLDPGTSPFTVDAWVIYKHASLNTPECTIVKKGDSGAGWRFVILPASDKLKFEMFGGNWLSAQASITPNVWHHVAATVARGPLTATITLYVDGLAASTSTHSIGSGVSVASTQSLFIGGDGVAAGEMAVDEVEIFHEALELADIEALFFACVSGKCKPDLGDAPDSTNHGATGAPMWAYPVVLAHFPTVYDPTLSGNAPLGPIHWNAKGPWGCGVWLGADVSIEEEADTGWDQDMSPWGNNIQPDVQISNRDADDGVANVSLQSPFPCGQTSVTFSATNQSTQPAQAYINVWFDWTHDGDWDDTPDTGNCLAGVFPVPEWAVQNHVVILDPGLNSGLVTPTFLFLTPLPGQTVWMRITLTFIPVSASDGSGPVGGYEYGETEDYELGPY